MSKDMLLRMGREKIANGLMSLSLKDGLPDKVLEIVGATKADYYGTTSLEEIEQKENDIYRVGYLKYINNDLTKCSFGDAIRTPEYINDNILIFSQSPENTLMYYVAVVIKG